MLGPRASGHPLGLASPLFTLQYPQSIGVFSSYAEAQRVVDTLADQEFPVGNLAIVGTDLKLVERVTGRKTWATVLGRGVTNGLTTAVIVALLMTAVNPGSDVWSMLLLALVIGVLIGIVFAGLGHALSRGERDFTSISQVVPARFEILCEHKVAAQARELLGRASGTRLSALYPTAAHPVGPPHPAPGGHPPGSPGAWHGGYPPAAGHGGHPPAAEQGGHPSAAGQGGYPRASGHGGHPPAPGEGGYPRAAGQGGYPSGPGHGGSWQGQGDTGPTQGSSSHGQPTGD